MVLNSTYFVQLLSPPDAASPEAAPKVIGVAATS